VSFHPEILTRAQQRALRGLGPIVAERGFYLVGGTALALHLGHRRSVDFDWFVPWELDDPLRLAEDLREAGLPFRTHRVAPGTLHGSVWNVRVSLLEYRYPLLRPPVTWSRLGCRLAARPDLGAMKLAALAQRGNKKDFVDVYALSLRRVSLRDMLIWYREKFAVSDVLHVLYSLAYFDEADRERMPRMLWPTTWPEVKARLRHWLRGLDSDWLAGRGHG
jgi:hypothetical protein